MNTVALIVAAGRGTRLGGGPKQYRLVGGKPIIRWAVDAFSDHPRVDAVRCVIHADDLPSYREAVDGLSLLSPVTGGPSRQESVRLGLESLQELKPRHVLVHDAARPFVSRSTIDECLQALSSSDGAVASVPVHDTLKRGGRDNTIERTIERTGLWRAQTPQGFDYAKLLQAHRTFAGEELTDDSAVAERAGLVVALTAGSEDNFKVTTTEDLDKAERRVTDAQRVFRVGTGFDVHRFDAGDAVILCGVTIPHDQSLSGHSDADVGLHALTDALLGAIACGDIGSHFPPSEAEWRGADSALFARHAAALVRERGGRIENVDVTLICEKPKIGPHRDAMVARVADILAIPVDCVSVKATTTEQLGFTGRGEGIAAQAAVSVSVPPAR